LGGEQPAGNQNKHKADIGLIKNLTRTYPGTSPNPGRTLTDDPNGNTDRDRMARRKKLKTES